MHATAGVSTKHNENEINSKTVSISTAEPVILNPCVFAASLLKGLKHANVVLLHDIIHNSETLTLVFEYVVRCSHQSEPKQTNKQMRWEL